MCRPIASSIASLMSGKRESIDIPAPELVVDGGTNKAEGWGGLGPWDVDGPEVVAIGLAVMELSWVESCLNWFCIEAC